MTIRAIGIHASAGTGKTHRLTNELISLFLQGHPPQSVFAATFTRAAAGEILDRVLRRLVAAAADPKGLAELRIALQNPDLSAAECRRIAASLARSIDRVAVWTIDSFLVRVATAFSVEIGLSPGWRIAGDDEDKRLRRAAVDRVLREGGREVIGPLLRMLKKSEGERSVRQSLIDVVNAVYAAQAGAAPQAWHAVVPAGDEMSSEDIARAVEAFGAAGLPVTRSGEPNKNWTKGRARAVEVARRHDWEGFLDSGFVGKFRSEGCYYQIPFPEGLA
nr:UvrD-helicase domain-containing protein [Phycisphaerales bacterium]